jgi:lipoate-protein ligase B
MNSHYLGRVEFTKANDLQLETAGRASRDFLDGAVLGFESEPTVTLGVRGGLHDLLCSEVELQKRGFCVMRLDRGGQATLHNPGQLVIFPVFRVREIGAKNWISLLLRSTQALARDLGQELCCDGSAPGLYSARGKVVSVGVRLRGGVSTHGLAINVFNDLEDFRAIRVCGRAGAPLDRLKAYRPLPQLFAAWVEAFQAEVDKRSILNEFREPISDARL